MDLDNDEFKLFAENAMSQYLRYIVIGGFAMYLNGLARHLNDLREQKVVARQLQDLRDIVMIDDFLARQAKGES